MDKNFSFIDSALRTIEIERAALAGLPGRIGADFERACRLILSRDGRVAVTGMGKSGHIGNKIAATLSSTGTPALFVHPAEAAHGDIGMITGADAALAISHSGASAEIIALLPVLRRRGIPLIAMTGKVDSELARAADIHLDASVGEEACPLGLAPTASTTAALALGDALAMALLEARGFSSEDFARSHPGGKLGARLLVKVGDVMHSAAEIPKVRSGTALTGALLEISAGGFGLTTVTDAAGHIAGVFSDGDLRRAIDAGRDIVSTRVEEVMSENFIRIDENALAAEAARIMQEAGVYVLIVTGAGGAPSGIVKMHDLLQANVV
ncbi:MAG: KpsF/GutQ family sugar-phosphate isomerase [Gammaproteobacteria bacterium]|nr:KpsF/GutQ family sugar-phosphate isomerase [Gammaproteobacteria bacterium]